MQYSADAVFAISSAVGGARGLAGAAGGGSGGGLAESLLSGVSSLSAFASVASGGSSGIPIAVLETTPLWVRTGETISVGSFESVPGVARYQWRKDGSDLADQTRPYLQIRDMSVDKEGHYTCLHYAEGSALTRRVGSSLLVRVTEPPACTAKHVQQAYEGGKKFTLDLRSATGTPAPVYQWSLNGDAIEGADEAMYSVDSMGPEHSGTYTCKISNIAGDETWEEAYIAFLNETVAEGGGEDGVQVEDDLAAAS
jgi:hypothetical protein